MRKLLLFGLRWLLAPRRRDLRQKQRIDTAGKPGRCLARLPISMPLRRYLFISTAVAALGITAAVAVAVTAIIFTAGKAFSVQPVFASQQESSVFLELAADPAELLASQSLAPLDLSDSSASPQPTAEEITHLVQGVIPGVSLTFYSCLGEGFCGPMSNGQVVYEGAAACSYDLPLGTRFMIQNDPTGRVYRCDDRGLLTPTWVDIFWYTPSDGWRWQEAVGRGGTIEIVDVPAAE